MSPHLIATQVRTTRRHRQSGYSLLELSIVLAIIALVIMSVIAMQVEQARTDKARAVAQMYTRLNNAVGTYMVNNYDKLVKLDASCAMNPYSTNMKNAYNMLAANNPEVCQLTVNGQTISNGLQPTLEELRNHGVLGDFGSNEPPLPVNTTDYTLPYSRDLVANQSRWMVLIRKLCVGARGDWSGPGEPYFVEAAGQYKGCYGSTDLESLVFNVHPYAVNNLGGSVFLSRILQFMGPDGYLSDLVGPAKDQGEELRAMKGSVFASVLNPMRTGMGEQSVLGWAGTPWPYILAMRNGYNSSGWDKYVRRDGSTPMSSDWDYGGKNVTNINELQANGLLVGKQTPTSVDGQPGVTTSAGNANLSGTVTIDGGNTSYIGTDGKLVVTNRKPGQLNVYGDSSVGGTLTADKGVFGNITDELGKSLNASLKAASAYIQDTLRVGGDVLIGGTLSVWDKATFYAQAVFNGGLSMPADATATFDGTVDLKGTTNVYQFALKNESTLGAACESTKESLRLQAIDDSAKYNDGLRLLVCDRATNKWVMPQPDLQSKIDLINTTLTTMDATDTSLAKLIQDMKDGKVQGSLQQQIDNLFQAIKDMKDGNLNGSLQWQINEIKNNTVKAQNNIQGHYFTINYTAYSCEWTGTGSCWTGGAVNANPNEWSAQIVNASSSETVGSGHVDVRGDHYWLDLRYVQSGSTQDLHVKWTSKVPRPTTSPANLADIASHATLTKECGLGWLNWTSDYGWTGKPQILKSCDLVDKSNGFSWVP